MRARLVGRAEDWGWSSVAAHSSGEDDELVRVAPLLERYGDFAGFLAEPADDEAAWRRLRMSETSGRPLGGDGWIGAIETRTGRTLKPRKRGPKPREKPEGSKQGEFSKLARNSGRCHFPD